MEIRNYNENLLMAGQVILKGTLPSLVGLALDAKVQLVGGDTR